MMKGTADARAADARKMGANARAVHMAGTGDSAWLVEIKTDAGFRVVGGPLRSAADRPGFFVINRSHIRGTFTEVVTAILKEGSKTCTVCGLRVKLADENDPESYVHDEDREFDDHTAEVGGA